MNLLSIDQLEVAVGAQQILRGVSLTVDETQIVAVLGANGVGKTSLMRALSGIYRCKSGRITFRGKSIGNRPSHEMVKQGIAQAPEGRQIFPFMSVLDNLRAGGVHRTDAENEEDLEAVLSLFPILRERLRVKGGLLSGGEQQMLSIGRALMARPTLLLLDEPSLGLAPLIVRQIFDLFREIRERGTAILLVEQNAVAALKVADYAYIMEGGRIVLHGAPKELAEDDRVREAYLGGHVTV